MERDLWYGGGQPSWGRFTTKHQDAVTTRDSSFPYQNPLFGSTPTRLSESVFHGNDCNVRIDHISSDNSTQYQQAIETLRRYPRSFVHAWLLLAKSLGVSLQRVGTDYLTGSALSIDEVRAIAALKDLPQDQILDWYMDDVTYGSFSSAPSHAQLWSSLPLLPRWCRKGERVDFTAPAETISPKVSKSILERATADRGPFHSPAN